MASVLIVDDSALVRRQLGRLLSENGFEVEFAKNGEEAINLIEVNDYDVVSLDINMPVMDGITTLTQIMLIKPLPVVVVSSLATKDAEVTFQALEIGAVDFVPKIGTMTIGKEETEQEIIDKITSASRIPKKKILIKKKATAKKKLLNKEEINTGIQITPEKTEGKPKTKSGSISFNKIVLIGASTGGPGLIEDICKNLPIDYPYPVCVVQHMPEKFTTPFAARLNRSCDISVFETKDNMEILPGNVYIAKGGKHLHFQKKITGKYVAKEAHNTTKDYFCPSVNQMFMSALNIFGGRMINAVLLTGIGDDGADGMVEIKKAGGYTIAESEETACVFGMPKEAIKRGGAKEVLPVDQIVLKIRDF